MKKAAKTWFNMGMAYLVYDWVFLPAWRWLDIQPWSLTAFGVLHLIMAVIAACLVCLFCHSESAHTKG